MQEVTNGNPNRPKTRVKTSTKPVIPYNIGSIENFDIWHHNVFEYDTHTTTSHTHHHT